jgi:hypothetical protein
VSLCACASWSRSFSTSRSASSTIKKIGQARVETQARQLRRFLRADGGSQQAFGALSFQPVLDEGAWWVVALHSLCYS